jgi:hypothetical protein
MPPGGLSKLFPLNSRHRQSIRIVLAEMYCLSADKLICLLYTKESSTAFLVEFDPVLWEDILEELVRVYGVEKPKKQTRVSSAAKVIKQKIENIRYMCRQS